MKEKPYIKYICGSILLIIIAIVCYNLFQFEPERKNQREEIAITDELVNDLNGYLISDRYNKKYTMYNDFYITEKNLSTDVVMSLVISKILSSICLGVILLILFILLKSL